MLKKDEKGSEKEKRRADALLLLLVRVKGLEQLHKRHQSLPEFYNHFGAMAFCKQNAVRFIATNYQHQQKKESRCSPSFVGAGKRT